MTLKTEQVPMHSYSRRLVRAFLKSEHRYVEVNIGPGDTPRRAYKRIWMYIDGQDRKGHELSKRVRVVMRGDRIYLVDPEAMEEAAPADDLFTPEVRDEEAASPASG